MPATVSRARGGSLRFSCREARAARNRPIRTSAVRPGGIGPPPVPCPGDAGRTPSAATRIVPGRCDTAVEARSTSSDATTRADSHGAMMGSHQDRVGSLIDKVSASAATGTEAVLRADIAWTTSSGRPPSTCRRLSRAASAVSSARVCRARASDATLRAVSATCSVSSVGVPSQPSAEPPIPNPTVPHQTQETRSVAVTELSAPATPQVQRTLVPRGSGIRALPALAIPRYQRSAPGGRRRRRWPGQ